MDVEPHWHLEADGNLGASSIEIIAHQLVDADKIPLVIIQAEDTIWLNIDQAKTLRDFINQEVLKRGH